MALLDHYEMLIDAVSKMDEVISIGKSGGEKLPENNVSDIDIFVRSFFTVSICYESVFFPAESVQYNLLNDFSTNREIVRSGCIK